MSHGLSPGCSLTTTFPFFYHLASLASFALTEKNGADERELRPLTVSEVHRLLCARDEPSWRRASRVRWSHFRRAHQALAQRYHAVRRARQHPFPSNPQTQSIVLVGLEELTPERWEQLGPLFPQQASTGRPAIEHRLIVEGIVWVIRTGSSWRNLPARFGPWQTVASRYQLWRKEGRWARILQILQQPAVPVTSSA